MLSKRLMISVAAAAVAAAGLTVFAAAQADDAAAPAMKSASVLAFAPNGVLLVGDSTGGAVFAIETGDTARPGAGKVEIADLTGKAAALLGVPKEQIALQDIAVNPMSGSVYISVHRGAAADMAPVILKADRAGALTVFSTTGHRLTRASITDGPTVANQQAQTITDIGFSGGKVLVAGLSNEQFSSSMRAFSYPLSASAKAASIEMYHGNHRRTETNAPVRTFLTYDVNGQPNVLAAYTCTPLVRIPVSEIRDGAQIKATTIAELGNLNRPIDMIAYTKDGKPYFLMANSARGVMRLDASRLESYPAITTPVPEGTAGVPYTTIAELTGITQLDKVDNANAVVVATADGVSNLRTIGLP